MSTITQPHAYHFIHRYGRSFQHSDIRWVYSCTCDVNRARFVESLNVFIDSCYEDFSNMQELSECIHVKASISIVTQLDAVHSITPSIEFVGMHMIITYQFIADTVLLLVWITLTPWDQWKTPLRYKTNTKYYASSHNV